MGRLKCEEGGMLKEGIMGWEMGRIKGGKKGRVMGGERRELWDGKGERF